MQSSSSPKKHPIAKMVRSYFDYEQHEKNTIAFTTSLLMQHNMDRLSTLFDALSLVRDFLSDLKLKTSKFNPSFHTFFSYNIPAHVDKLIQLEKVINELLKECKEDAFDDATSDEQRIANSVFQHETARFYFNYFMEQVVAFAQKGRDLQVKIPIGLENVLKFLEQALAFTDLVTDLEVCKACNKEGNEHFYAVREALIQFMNEAYDDMRQKSQEFEELTDYYLFTSKAKHLEATDVAARKITYQSSKVFRQVKIARAELKNYEAQLKKLHESSAPEAEIKELVIMQKKALEILEKTESRLADLNSQHYESKQHSNKIIKYLIHRQPDYTPEQRQEWKEAANVKVHKNEAEDKMGRAQKHYGQAVAKYMRTIESTCIFDEETILAAMKEWDNREDLTALCREEILLRLESLSSSPLEEKEVSQFRCS